LPEHYPDRRLGLPFIELQSVDSTNNYALRQVRAGLAYHGMAIFAHEQVAGKGQRGKIWTAEKDSSLILSIALKPYPLLVNQQFQLSACVATTVCEFFQKYAGDAVKIKWPNDLYWHDRKAGGILIENIIGQTEKDSMTSVSGWQWAVIGVGININQGSFDAGLSNPVSLKQITRRHFNTLEIAKELCDMLDKRFSELLRLGFADIYARYLKHLYKIGERVKLKKGNRIFEALIKTVNSTGELIIEHGTEETISTGEVQWII
jgi:BirA family transcriptional regulator, biotin operon repressor / biotin---[acetyl-CoA-carboxylase] ligase